MKKLLALPIALAFAANVNIAQAASSDHALKHQMVGVFLGATDAQSTDFSFGFEYEYRFNHQWGVGVVWEKTLEGHEASHGVADAHDSHNDHHDSHQTSKDDVSVVVAEVYYHYDGFRFGFGAGQEKIHSAHSHTESLVRISGAYDYHITDSWAVAPVVAIDKVGDNYVRVFGLTVNYLF